MDFTTIERYPSVELYSQTPLECTLHADISIKITLISRPIMQDDLNRHPSPKPFPRRTSSRPQAAYNTSLITLPNLNFNITSIPSNVITQIGSLPSLFTHEAPLPLEEIPALAQDSSYRLFIDQMKDPVCAQFAAEVQQYLSAINASRTRVSSDAMATYCHSFVQRMRQGFKKSTSLSKQTAAHLDTLIEGLENYIHAKSYAT